MNLSQAIHAFAVDLKTQAAIVLIALDFVFGVLASLRKSQFRLSYIADFAKNDIAFKLLPWAGLYVAAKFAGDQQLVIPGVDLSVAETAAYAVIVAAWTGSLLDSLDDLGFRLPPFVGGPEKPPPPAPPPPEA